MEDSEVMKVSTRELKEQVLSPDESSEKIVRKARQARSELFQIFRHGANEVLIACKVRWDEQLKGLTELERRCLALRVEVEHLSERQEVLAVLTEGKMNMQKTAPEDLQRQIFRVFKELEEQKTKEALELVQKKHKLIKWEGERREGKDSVKVGVVKGNRAVVRSPRQFLLGFVLILFGL